MWGFTPNPRFQMMIEEATGGRLKIETIVNLVPSPEVLFAVIDGRADMGFQWTPYVSGTFPIWDVASLPFFWGDGYEYERAINDPRMIEIIDKTHADADLIKLYDPVSGALDAVFGNKPVRTVGDFKGLKIRTSGILPTFTLELLGAAPLTMATAEQADALKRGTVDAVLTSTPYGAGIGLLDVTSYISYWAIQSFYGGELVINMNSWNALPADIQQILKEVGMVMQGQTFYASECVYDKISKVIVRAATEVIEPEASEVDKARALAKPAIDKWLEVAGPYGPEVLAIAADYASGAEIMLAK